MTQPSNPKVQAPVPSRTPPELRYYRLKQIVAPTGLLPISASTWWQGVKNGRYPQPVKLGPRITAWSAQDIEAYLGKMRGGPDHG